MRGEQDIRPLQSYILMGSPPLARGTAWRQHGRRILARITPACAGNRAADTSPRTLSWDHPRLRGEQRKWAVTEICRIGSPPLARGTACAYQHGTRRRRITPACAGNSAACAEEKSAPWDHPRLRGEQPSSYGGLARGMVSPPLARGTATLNELNLARIGITPACAGNSQNPIQNILQP